MIMEELNKHHEGFQQDMDQDNQGKAKKNPKLC